MWKGGRFVLDMMQVFISLLELLVASDLVSRYLAVLNVLVFYTYHWLLGFILSLFWLVGDLFEATYMEIPVALKRWKKQSLC